MSDPIAFEASLPAIQTAIKIAGDGGARVQLDIPETELPAIARLLLARGRVLRVTIEVQESSRSDDDGSSEAHSRTARCPTDLAGS